MIGPDLRPERLSLSVAIPVYNEESVLPDLFRRTTAVLDTLEGGPHELVLVDDGSSDGTWEILESLVAIDPRVRAVRLSRNFGHQAALSAALDCVAGDVVVVMDGDLQDTPETIPRMLSQYRLGFDVVYAIRHRRKESWWLRACFALFYRVIAAVADVPLPRGTGDFALMSRRVVELIKANRERNRYLRGLRAWVGFRQTGIVVERDARHSGRSKYSLRRLFRLACDGIFSFSQFPLRAATWSGLFVSAAAVIGACLTTLSSIVYWQLPAATVCLAIGMTLLAGVQLLFLGVVGQYVGRIYDEVKQRPIYLIEQRLGEPQIDRASGSPATRMDRSSEKRGEVVQSSGSI